MTAYNEQDLLQFIKNINGARKNILNMYENSLYEDNWDNNIIHEFDIQLEIYNNNVNTLKEMAPSIPWSKQENKKKWYDTYYNLIVEDNKIFNLVKIRHEAYLVYRTNRKAIIKQLNEVVGFVKTKNNKKLTEVFDYFNNACAKIKMYDNRNAKGEVTATNNNSVLYKWFFENKSNVTADINDSPSVEDIYSIEECAKIFIKYIKCRQSVFNIFNMITSSSEINGYEKWHNILDIYCQGDLTNAQLEKLYNASNNENDFLPVDDYQQIMDDKTWNIKGIYESKSLNESWLTDEINKYNELYRSKLNKENIKTINMIPTNANICKVVTDGKAVFAATNFYPGDIVEICPTRIIDKSSLYSKDMREVVFEVIPNKEWVLPFGYCQFYDIPNNNISANCEFIWDPINRVIVIKAIDKIKKHNKLILKVEN